MKQKRRRKQAAPKVKIKEVYPISFTRLVEKLRIPPGSVHKFAAEFPPDYSTCNVRRYKCVPEIAARFKIIKTVVGFTVVGIYQQPEHTALFEGTEQECYSVRAEAVKRWWNLPRGREFATVAQEILGLKELQK